MINTWTSTPSIANTPFHLPQDSNGIEVRGAPVSGQVLNHGDVLVVLYSSY